MTPVRIKRNEEILAHHTTQHPASHHGRPIWCIKEQSPEPGPAVWTQGDRIVEVDIMGMVGEWFVCRQHEGLLYAILWRDGGYYGDLIEDRTFCDPVKDVTLEDLKSAKYRVCGAVAIDAWGGESPLGCVVS